MPEYKLFVIFVATLSQPSVHWSLSYFRVCSFICCAHISVCTNSKEDLRSESKDERKFSEGTVAGMGVKKGFK